MISLKNMRIENGVAILKIPFISLKVTETPTELRERFVRDEMVERARARWIHMLMKHSSATRSQIDYLLDARLSVPRYNPKITFTACHCPGFNPPSEKIPA